jgi:hypothetical protein
MTHIVRYTAVCLWLSLLISGVGSLGFLSALRPLVGIELMPVVAAVGLAAVFFGVAWMVHRIGMKQVARLMRSADAAEREGRSAKAEAAWLAALAAVDRFWISPAYRRRVLMPLAGRLARFYLSQVRLHEAAEDFLVRYLDACPEDEEVAEQWLRQIEGRDGLREEHQDLAERLGEAHPQHPPIQRALARFYLRLERTDYVAMRSYRRVCDAQGQPPDEFGAELSRILQKHGRSEPGTYQAYSRARERGPAMDLPQPLQERGALRAGGEPTASEAVAPADEWVPSEDVFHLTTDVDAADDEEVERPISLLAEQRSIRPHLRRFGHAAGSALKTLAREGIRLGGFLVQAIGCAGRQRAVRYGLGVLAAAGLTAGWIWVGMDALEYFGPTASVPESAELSGPAPAAATDPFTLQVAAYLKQEYALKRMEDLKRQGLDAYWTETSSGGKIWFQVRVSHFPDLSTAREYGRKLKGKGVIEDFYVTNNVR